MQDTTYIRWFSDLERDDVSSVGGKNASLGELYRHLRPLGVEVPDGFALTAAAFRDALTEAKAWDELHRLLDPLDKTDVVSLARAGARAREIVYAAGLTPRMEDELRAEWRGLLAKYGETLTVAVRSSATAEDLPTASFAGQHESYLNVAGEIDLLDAVRRCHASLFTDRAISYRIDQGFDHFKVALSVGVQKMVRADLGAAGVMFTLDTESGFRDVVFITGAYGLGETVVQGAVDPDEFYVHKPTFRQGHRAVLRRRLGEKQVRMIYRPGRTREPTRIVPTPNADRERFCLTDEEVLRLAEYAIRIEDHYGQPMDIEWAKDGLDGGLYIVQARPETVASRSGALEMESFVPEGKGRVLATGRAVGARIASGPARVVTDAHHLSAFRPGEVLVADTTTPDWEPVMKTAAAIVTNRGGRTCHAAIVARELGIPAVVGAERATSALSEGQVVTVSCAEGDTGMVYDGAVPFRVDRVDLSLLSRPQTRIMVNLGNPDQAFRNARLPVDGVGLARMEFIIIESIKAHPMALIHRDRVEDAAERDHIARLIRHYPDGSAYFVERLSEGIGTIAAAFHPRPVIVRLSDFKTNEYASLIGGRWFEPVEENPMLGFRGAARYAHPAYEEGFALECKALVRVRETMGLTNVKVMVPFCRRLDEAERVIAAMARHGLERGRDGLEVYVMCEIPNNVLLVDEFAKLFDGFSIGSNDLTQLTLGVDRDSPLVAFDFDERDPGVLAFLRQAVEGAKRNGRPCGICGQAPSDYPEVAEFLVRLGIDSISLTPDSVLKTLSAVVDLERQLGRAPREAG
ncbi:phosphoenolpyruvate synthase [Skermanella aerolata]|uniref:Phosphoenolpyruvate synthase n=1 Tax=Skermanella aerolata TaxID=393310 RepID=A0A512E1D7_9PROT|nr:phosphoenolpyruvate synthase [Skermanella aerolata]KJB91028.1 phosphoenolpyruvate synthase [Skermanella aerolata KACC 11604]GEO42531.1 phosphoenolpyruvate synthase [Skermanella aerolata]